MKKILLYVILSIWAGKALPQSIDRPQSVALPQSITHSQSVAAPSNIAFSNGASSTGWMNFDFYRGNQIFIPVMINGHEAIAMLITGLATTMIDKEFAIEIGLQPKDAGAADSTTVDIRLGNLTLQHVKVNMTLSKSTGHPRNLLLSDELFNTLAVDIDFNHHRLACYTPASVTPPAGAVELPLNRAADSRTVPVSVENGPPVPCEVFLGDPAPLTVYEAYDKHHALLSSRPHSIRLGGGSTHPREATATLSRVRFAGADFYQVPAVFPSDSVRGSNSTLVSGNIGMAILSGFRLIFDYSHDRLYAVPYPRTSSMTLAKDRSGLFLVEKDGHYIVEFVAPASPAEKAGFQPGDGIRLIDQKPVLALQGEAWQSPALGSLRPMSAGTTFVFTMDDGSLRPLKTADYF
jgi:hypothetical protein